MARLNQRFVLKILIARKIRKRQKQRKRSMYIRPIFRNRFVQGEHNLVRELAKDPYYHHRYFRMNKETFEEILSMLGDRLEHGQNLLRPISALERLAITMREFSVDADQNFILVDVGPSESCSDGGVFKNSKFEEKCERGQYELPPSKVLNGAVFNSVILGDDGFPLKPYLMKPYSGSCKMENILDNHRRDTSTRNTYCESYDSTTQFFELSE
ncbi:unnamed protein product [Allacma fusca]|uniref:DDE Tnp4 domain-containing protein n=1 Tax=Allacma fusca TaxID=39272 RepID=A0A8J2L922_9HEXA|nr:unnamed protein product [Allacma fusca]